MWFKVSFLAVFFASVSIAAWTARRASRRHGTALNQLTHEVRGLIVVRVVLGLVFYFALAAWLFWSDSLRWMYFDVPTFARWTAAALLVPALLFFAWSYWTLGTNYRGGVGLYTDHELVTSGPYHLIRHPIYWTFVVIMFLVLILSANWVLGLSGIALVCSIAFARIPVEDRELHERFGREWESYRARSSLGSHRD